MNPVPDEAAKVTVPVAGGELAVDHWGGGAAPPVLALHGITANGQSFARTATELVARGGPPLLAPDLRGRGRSAHLPGPYGLDSHVDDAIAVLDDRAVDRTVLLGHSMGAFVACLVALRHPDRVAGVLLVDGGLGLPVPEGTDIGTVLGPAMARLGMTFPDTDAYRRYWGRHPAFTGRWNAWVDRYILRDLVGQEPVLRPTCAEEPVRVDGAQLLSDPETRGAVHRLACPARLLWAARGLQDESPGMYTQERLAGLPSWVGTVALPEDNHYTPLFGPTAALIAEQVHTLVGETG